METGKRIIAGRYRLESVVGSGGMGVVWRAFDQRLERQVAIKEVRFPDSVTAEERTKLTDRALAEAQSAGQLDHPNIVPVHDVIEYDERPYIIMRLVDGASLDQLITADGPLDPVSTAAIGVSLVGALAAAHAANIVHRDVKPQNVMIQRNGTALLTDFSIAAAFSTGTITGTGVLLGSPGYIAPERLMSGRTGPAGDLFGLGATLYYAVEGVGPFAMSEPLAGLFATATQPHPRPQRAGQLTPVIDGLLAKEPDDRLTAAKALELLEEIVESRRQSTRVARSITPAPAQTRIAAATPPGPPTPHSIPPSAAPHGLPVAGPPVAGPPVPRQRPPTQRQPVQGDEPSDAVTQQFSLPPGLRHPTAEGRQPGGRRPQSAALPPAAGPPTGGPPTVGPPPHGAPPQGRPPRPAQPGGGRPSRHGQPVSQFAAEPVDPLRGPVPPPPTSHRNRHHRSTVFVAAGSVLTVLIAAGVIAGVVANRHHAPTVLNGASDVSTQKSVSPSASSTRRSTPAALPQGKTSKSPTPRGTSDPTSGPSAARVASAHLTLSPGHYTGNCRAVRLTMTVRITVTRTPATIRYTVHQPGGGVRTGTATLSGSSTSFARTMSQTFTNLTSGSLGAYVTVSSPSSVTSSPSTARLNCTSTAPPPPPPSSPPPKSPPPKSPPPKSPPPSGTTSSPPQQDPPASGNPPSSGVAITESAPGSGTSSASGA